MTVKRLIPSHPGLAQRRRDFSYLARTDDRVIQALEALLREGGVSSELGTLLDRRDATRQRLQSRPGQP